MPKLPDLMSQDQLRAVLKYDRHTGIFTWLMNRGRTAKAGDKAGVEDHHGYIVIGIAGHKFQAQRVAWFYVYGEWPQDRIRFRNGDKTDIRLANLVKSSDVLSTYPRARYQRENYAKKRLEGRIVLGRQIQAEQGPLADPTATPLRFSVGARVIYTPHYLATGLPVSPMPGTVREIGPLFDATTGPVIAVRDRNGHTAWTLAINLTSAES